MWQEIRCIMIRIETSIVSKWKYHDTYRISDNLQHKMDLYGWLTS